MEFCHTSGGLHRPLAHRHLGLALRYRGRHAQNVTNLDPRFFRVRTLHNIGGHDLFAMFVATIIWVGIGQFLKDDAERQGDFQGHCRGLGGES
eukprot:7150805-Pyramimonas_sp.AAC.1